MNEARHLLPGLVAWGWWGVALAEGANRRQARRVHETAGVQPPGLRLRLPGAESARPVASRRVPPRQVLLDRVCRNGVHREPDARVDPDIAAHGARRVPAVLWAVPAGRGVASDAIAVIDVEHCRVVGRAA